MRILIAHNRYQQRGGEDAVVDSESTLLERAGHTVERFFVTNDAIASVSGRIRAAVRILDNPPVVERFIRTMEGFSPDIVHFHNAFPLISPGAVLAAVRQGMATVQTVHNFRPICANALFLRDGKICVSCLGAARWPAVVHRCYRGSAIGSFAVARMGRRLAELHRDFPDQLTFIALTDFAKIKLVADGYAPERIMVKGNAAPDWGIGPTRRERRIVFAGRLSEEKGADRLLRMAIGCNAQFEIIGDGPQLEGLRRSAPNNVVLRGGLPREATVARIKTALAVVVPSRCFEGFPVVIAEAFATGTPVIASRLGALPTLVSHERTGLIVPPDDEAAWQHAASRLVQDMDLASRWGIEARRVYERVYSESANLGALETIYRAAIKRARRANPQARPQLPD